MATAKRPVYAVTNFDTRIVVAVYMDSTVDHFKEEFESAHLNCFPEFGKIRVEAVMVQRKSCFYHLPNLFPLKNAFESKDWIIHVVAQPLQKQSASTKNTKIGASLKKKKWKKGAKFPPFKTFSRDVYPQRRYNKCRTRKIKDSNHKVKDFGGNLQECLSESEAVSVSGIIDRYFSGYDEVSSKSILHSHVQYETNLKLLEEKPSSSIGVRVVKASKSLGLSTTKNTLASSLSKHIRRPIFEFSCGNE